MKHDSLSIVFPLSIAMDFPFYYNEETENLQW